MGTKPLVGINMDLCRLAKGRVTYSVVHTGYYDCVLKAGGIPMLIPPLTKQPEFEPILDRLDALILGGGDDLDPKRLGLRPHMTSKVMEPRREDSDRLLCRLAAERKLPTLGIGVGMQLLNVLCGGTIYQHLPEDLPRALPHHDPLGGSHRHAIEVTPGSRMDDIYGGGDIRVNSHHHQAVRRVASKFRVSALAPDGIVEAIESTDPQWFCIGVQWNPEAETGSALDMQLFEALVAACDSRAVVMAA